ncbi:MAG: very short patch repair endonuclease [Chitinivibrionia bacterium]|nr:very short patch repair endonuclease [Chitinivibrionia bacterium]
MSDVFDKTKRSKIMSAVRSKKNISTEIKLISLFKKYKITGWIRGYKVKGKPDFTFLKRRVVIFADGCFWHGHRCRNTAPKDNAEYWRKKIERNIARDVTITAAFEARGWTVLRIWECELKRNNIETTMERINAALYAI